MTTHYKQFCDGGWSDGVACGYQGDLDLASGHNYTAGMHLVTCHRCLEEVVNEGERAVQRIIELDKAAGTQ